MSVFFVNFCISGSVTSNIVMVNINMIVVIMVIVKIN